MDDDSGIREALRLLFDSSPVHVLGEADSAAAGIELVERLNPDMALLDISMPGMNGFRAARELRRRMPHVHVIFLSEHTDRAYVDEAFESGARAYVFKKKASRDLLNAVQAVLSGHTFISPSPAGLPCSQAL